jgi:hypothetical protein
MLSRVIALRFLPLLFILLLTACASDLPGRADLSGQEILYRDDFSPAQVGYWLTESDDAGYTAVADGRLLIDLNAPNLIQYTTLRDRQFDNFVLEIDVNQLAGAADSSHGVLFRMQPDNDAFYRFAITGSGFFIVERRDADGNWHRLMRDWLESRAIRQGLNVTNRLRVEAVGPQISVYANGELLQQVTDGRYSQGGIGLEAGTFGPASTRVAFDNLVVLRP